MATNELQDLDTIDRLDAVIAEYLEAVERGESTDSGAWCERYPEFADDLEHFFAEERQFDRIVSPLRPPCAGAPSPASSAMQTTQPLRQVQDYDLLEEIGRGGMGVIYKARQRSLKRMVAIKMIRSGEWATPAERLRFRWEAEAIAALDHPNIVPIIEVGEVPGEDGALLPFFSMKLIEGGNLAQHRDRFRDNWKAIARLLAIVARAIDHAHQRGILHRDLKPANILLSHGDDPRSTDRTAPHSAGSIEPNTSVPHLTDFGLAAHVHRERGQTATGTVVGTLSYLAPELASGQAAATIASDVYALGAILYELLAGAPPHRGDTPLETIRLLMTSAIRSPRSHNHAIPLDLETICLKCLESMPANRYPSAAKIADDLELFLTCRPISARPVGAVETLRRWCGRNPSIAGLGSALAISLVISLPLIVWNWRRAVENERIAKQRLEDTLQERERANNGFRVAHAAFGDLFKMLGDSNSEELAESETLNKELLERGLKYYRDFVDQRKEDPDLRRELGAAMFRVAVISHRIKTYQEAVAAYDETIAFLRSLVDQYPDDIALMDSLSRTLSLRGQALRDLGRVDESIHSSQEAVELWSRLPEREANLAGAQRSRAIAIMEYGRALQTSGDWMQAQQCYEQARAIFLSSPEPGWVTGPLSSCLVRLAYTESHLNQFDQALKTIAEAKQIAERLHRQSPHSEEARLLLAQALQYTGKIQMEAGKWADAEAAYIAALSFYEGLNRAKPRMTQYKESMALAFADLATVEKQLKKTPEVIRALEKGVIQLRELSQVVGDSRNDRKLYAQTASRLGDAFEEAKNYAAAAQAYEESRQQRRIMISIKAASPDEQIGMGRTCFRLGNTLFKVKKHQEAASAFEEAVENYRAALRDRQTDRAIRKDLSSSLGNCAIVYRNLARLADALTVTEERAALWPSNHAELIDAASDFARTYDSLFNKGEDKPELKRRALQLAIQTTQQALAAGLPNLDTVRSDAAFARVREAREFKELLGKK